MNKKILRGLELDAYGSALPYLFTFVFILKIIMISLRSPGAQGGTGGW